MTFSVLSIYPPPLHQPRRRSVSSFVDPDRSVHRKGMRVILLYSRVYPLGRRQVSSAPGSPRGEEETAAEKAARAKAAELEIELGEANVKVEDLERELTKAEQIAKDARDARTRCGVLGVDRPHGRAGFIRPFTSVLGICCSGEGRDGPGGGDGLVYDKS